MAEHEYDVTLVVNWKRGRTASSEYSYYKNRAKRVLTKLGVRDVTITGARTSASRRRNRYVHVPYGTYAGTVEGTITVSAPSKEEAVQKAYDLFLSINKKPKGKYVTESYYDWYLGYNRNRRVWKPGHSPMGWCRAPEFELVT